MEEILWFQVNNKLSADRLNGAAAQRLTKLLSGMVIQPVLMPGKVFQFGSGRGAMLDPQSFDHQLQLGNHFDGSTGFKFLEQRFDPLVQLLIYTVLPPPAKYAP